MAAHGKGMVMNVATAAVARLEEVNLEVAFNLAEASGADADAKEYLPGQEDYTLSATMVWHESDTAQTDLLEGGQLTVEYFPAGTGMNYSGTMAVETAGVASSKDDVVRQNVTLKGPLTKSAA